MQDILNTMIWVCPKATGIAAHLWHSWGFVERDLENPPKWSMIAILVGKPPFCGETWIFKNQDHQQMIFHYSDPSLLRWPWLFNDNLVYLWVHEDYPYLWFSWHSRLVLLRKSWEFHSSSWFLGCFVQNFPKKLWWPCHPCHATKMATEIGVPQ